MNLAYGQGVLKLEINIPPQHILAKSKEGLIIEGGVSLSEYGISFSKQSAIVEIKLLILSITCFLLSQLLHCELLHLLLLSR